MAAIVTREQPDSPDAIILVTELETHLETLYPPASRHGYSVETLVAQAVAFFVLRDNNTPAGCAGIELFGTAYGEISLMYVRPQFRGLGYGKLLLVHLNDHAREHGVSLLRLETGIYQAAAIRLYEGAGFQRIAPFAPTHMTHSVFVTRSLSAKQSVMTKTRRGRGDQDSADGASRGFSQRFSALPDPEVYGECCIEAMVASDWDHVRAIYLEGIVTGQATFEVEAPSWDEWDAAHHEFSRFAARADARVLGWAALSPVSRRCCYSGVAEVSVYVSASLVASASVGDSWLQLLPSRNPMVSGRLGATFPENDASRRLQKACGFREIGRRERIPELRGFWRDTILTERRSTSIGTHDHGDSDSARRNQFDSDASTSVERRMAVEEVSHERNTTAWCIGCEPP